MKLKIINLIGEILDEITSWFSLFEIFVFLAIAGIIVAIFVPLLAN